MLSVFKLNEGKVISVKPVLSNVTLKAFLNVCFRLASCLGYENQDLSSMVTACVASGSTDNASARLSHCIQTDVDASKTVLHQTKEQHCVYHTVPGYAVECTEIIRLFIYVTVSKRRSMSAREFGNCAFAAPHFNAVIDGMYTVNNDNSLKKISTINVETVVLRVKLLMPVLTRLLFVA